MTIKLTRCFLLFLIVLNICHAHSHFRNNRQRKNFIFYKTNSLLEKPCDCSMGMACNCCENVMMLAAKAIKSLCANFTYQRNGLNVDISMNGMTLRAMTVTNYRPFRMCSIIPGSLFSSACITVMQLNLVPEAINACVRLDVKSNVQKWKINYTCMTISTVLPMMMPSAAPEPEAPTMMMMMQPQVSSTPNSTEMVPLVVPTAITSSEVSEFSSVRENRGEGVTIAMTVLNSTETVIDDIETITNISLITNETVAGPFNSSVEVPSNITDQEIVIVFNG